MESGKEKNKMKKTYSLTNYKSETFINSEDINVISKFWEKFPEDYKRRLNYGRKVNGDYSVHNGGYKTLKHSGKFIKNHIPENVRDLFIQMFITNDLEYFEKVYKESKGYKSNRHDWTNK